MQRGLRKNWLSFLLKRFYASHFVHYVSMCISQAFDWGCSLDEKLPSKDYAYTFSFCRQLRKALAVSNL